MSGELGVHGRRAGEELRRPTIGQCERVEQQAPTGVAICLLDNRAEERVLFEDALARALSPRLDAFQSVMTTSPLRCAVLSASVAFVLAMAAAPAAAQDPDRMHVSVG